MLNSDVSPTCPYNTVNFCPLTAEIGWRVWGTPANFNGFLVLAVLLHSSSARHPNFTALNTGRHLYSAGRPSGWALAHISSMFLVSSLFFFCLVPCGRLSWLLVSFWAHVNIVHRIVSYNCDIWLLCVEFADCRFKAVPITTE